MSGGPHGRLAKAIFDKFHNDARIEDLDKSDWYSVNSALLPLHEDKFLPLLRPDEATCRWIERAKTSSTNIWLHIWHSFASSILQLFMTQTDINGYLRRGSMFILSEEQFGKLLFSGGFDPKSRSEVVFLDVGAGDGEISIRLVQSLKTMKMNLKVRTFVTESSWTMREILKQKKFSVLDKIESCCNADLISCLNVLDRCYDPYEILSEMYKALAPDGRIIIALVLPYSHYVEFNSSHLPIRPLLKHWPSKAKQMTFEKEAGIFFEMLESLGFTIEAWTKAPYLCEGDLRQSFYWLIDLVVVLSK